MAFDAAEWKSQIAAIWRRWTISTLDAKTRLGIKSAYGLLAASAWLPLRAAYVKDDAAAIAALARATGDIGNILVAKLRQGAYDDKTCAQEIEKLIESNLQAGAELDAMLDYLAVVQLAQNALGTSWQAFLAQLRADMSKFDSPRVQSAINTNGGAYVGGGVAIGGGTFVGRDNIQFNMPSNELQQLRPKIYRRLQNQHAVQVIIEEDRNAGRQPTFADAELGGIILSDMKLDRISFQNANLSKCNLTRVSFRLSDMRGINLSESVLSGGVDMSDAQLVGADLRKLAASSPNLSHAELVSDNRADGELKKTMADAQKLINACLARADLTDARLEGVELSRAVLTGAELRWANLSRATLRDARLENARLGHVNLSRADLTNANLRGADLSRADLSNAYLENADLRGAILDGAILHGAKISARTLLDEKWLCVWKIVNEGWKSGESEGGKLLNVELSGVDLSRANLNLANLRGVKLQKANLSGATLDGSILTNAFLEEANLNGAGLRNARLDGAKMSNACLSNADLTQAILCHAELQGADLTQANLARAEFVYANLAGADLTEANLLRADLSNANLDGTIFTRANLRGCQIDADAHIGDKWKLIHALTNSCERRWHRNLAGADLSGADLSQVDLHIANLNKANMSNCILDDARLDGCNLSEANLRGSSLKHAYLHGARLDNADLSLCDLNGTDITQEQIESAKSVAYAKLPNF